MDEIIITNHATQRGKERCGLSKKAFEKLAMKAYEKGICHKDLHGDLRNHVDWLFLSHKTANNMKLYGDYIFLFNQNLLITVMRIPNHLLKNLKDTKKKKEKQNQVNKKEEILEK